MFVSSLLMALFSYKDMLEKRIFSVFATSVIARKTRL